ncbi:hypothetical protein [Dyadobacter sp. 32]|uniref:hypothetical protein n=1 Tax=Dyadobacter sp. 32 TaxID=538966 RepID=UPI0011EE759B
MDQIVPNSTFNKFYSLLCDQIDQQFFTGNSRPTKGKRKMWETAKVQIQGDPPRSVSVSRHLFGTADDYFYRRHRDSMNGRKVSLDFDPFIKALEFIKIELPGTLADNKHLTNQQKCNALLDRFCLIYPLVQFDQTISSPHSLITEVIRKFYGSISIQDQVIDAWRQLSPAYQTKWGQDFLKFKSGYVNCKSIRNLAIFNFVDVSASEIDCMVYYDDEIEAYSSPALASLDSLLVKDEDRFTKILSEMRLKAENLGISEFENIELHKLFDPVASEYIWYKCNFSEKKHYNFFPTAKTTIVKRLYKCTCRRVDGIWLIERLVKLTTYSVR